MKDGLTQVKELKDKIHEQYMEIQELNKARKFDIEYNKYLQKEIIRLNNIIKQQDTRNSRQRVANKKLQEENNFLKQLIPNEKKYSYGIRMGSDKE